MIIDVEAITLYQMARQPSAIQKDHLALKENLYLVHAVLHSVTAGVLRIIVNVVRTALTIEKVRVFKITYLS